MAKKKEVSEIHVKGNKLECAVCKHDQFWTRTTLMNTPGLTFLGFDWANKRARNFICDNCGYVMWFLSE